MFSYLFPSFILMCFLVLPLTCLSHVFYWPLFPIRISSFPSDDYRFVENYYYIEVYSFYYYCLWVFYHKQMLTLIKCIFWVM